MEVYGVSKGVAGFFLGVGALGAIGLIIPPLAALEAAVLLSGGAVGGFFGWCAKGYGEARKKADEIFAPVYAAADAVDADIRRCFPYGSPGEACRPLSEDGEWAYRRMDAGGRREVEEDLRRMLAAGALDMGEAELDTYLAGLAGKEETPDG